MSRRKAIMFMEHAKWWPSTHLVRKRIDDLLWEAWVERAWAVWNAVLFLATVLMATAALVTCVKIDRILG